MTRVYGLGAHVQGADHGRRQGRGVANSRSGQVHLNYPAWDPHAPFGGFKQIRKRTRIRHRGHAGGLSRGQIHPRLFLGAIFARAEVWSADRRRTPVAGTPVGGGRLRFWMGRLSYTRCWRTLIIRSSESYGKRFMMAIVRSWAMSCLNEMISTTMAVRQVGASELTYDRWPSSMAA